METKCDHKWALATTLVHTKQELGMVKQTTTVLLICSNGCGALWQKETPPLTQYPLEKQ